MKEVNDIMVKKRKVGRPPIYQKKSGRDIDISIIIPRDVSRWLIRAGKKLGHSRSMQICDFSESSRQLVGSFSETIPHLF